MAAFKQDFKFVQSADGKTATFTDLSNWANNDENYTRALFTRSIALVDAYGATIDTIELNPTVDVFTLPLTKDLWVAVTATYDEIVGAAYLVKTSKLPLNRFLVIAYKKKVRHAKNNPQALQILAHANVFIQAANDTIPVGDSVEYQENIDAAYSILVNTNHKC